MEEDSKQSISEHAKSELEKIETSSATAQAELQEKIGLANSSKTELEKSVSESLRAIERSVESKNELDNSVESAKKAKADVDASTTSAVSVKEGLDGVIEDAAAGKQALDQTVQTASTLDAALSGKLTDGRALVAELETAGQQAVTDIQTEAGVQLDKVQHAADEIIVDREQINTNKSNIEQLTEKLQETIANQYALRRTGKVYQTKIWKFASNPTSAGEKLLDNAGLEWEPSTDTVLGADDYADIPMFQWMNVNYVRDDDGSPRPVAIEGDANYKTEGPVDVGVMQMPFWWKWDTSNADYDLVTVSDSPNAYLGLVPWSECVRADGTVLPWCIGSKYFSGIASDGLLRSQPGLPLAAYQSYNSMNVDYQKKGSGYHGAGAERNTFQIIFNIIKGATKNSHNLYAGCTSYSFQYPASIERSERLTYFPVSNAQAENVLIGSRVYVGYGSNNNGTINTDRGATSMRKYADMAKVLKKEPIDESNIAVYLDIEEGFSTTPVTLTDTLSAQIVMSSMEWGAGSTDAVIGHHDGSIVSNSNGKYPYRLQGREYAVGCYSVASDTVIIFGGNNVKEFYVADKGVKRGSSVETLRSTYRKIGSVGYLNSSWWVGDVGVDAKSGAWFPSSQGAGSAQGYGDVVHDAQAQGGTLREYLQAGHLGSWSGAGGALLVCWNGLGSGGWNYGG